MLPPGSVETSSGLGGGAAQGMQPAAAAADLDMVLSPLAATLAVVYRRPYLARGAAERSLLLLQALLEVGVSGGAVPACVSWWQHLVGAVCCHHLAANPCSPRGRRAGARWWVLIAGWHATLPHTAHTSRGWLAPCLQACAPLEGAAASPLHPLHLWLSRVLCECSEELCSFASMRTQALWTAQERCGVESLPSTGSPADSSGALPPEAAAAASAARLAVTCLASATAMLSRLSGAPGAVESAAVSTLARLEAALHQLVREFVGSHTRLGPGAASASLGPGADASSSRAGEDEAGAAGSGAWTAALKLSAVQLECVTACLHGLAAAQRRQQAQPGSPAGAQGKLAAVVAALLPVLLGLHQEGGDVTANWHKMCWWRAVGGVLDLAKASAGAACSIDDRSAGHLLRMAGASLALPAKGWLLAVLRCVRWVEWPVPLGCVRACACACLACRTAAALVTSVARVKAWLQWVCLCLQGHAAAGCPPARRAAPRAARGTRRSHPGAAAGLAV